MNEDVTVIYHANCYDGVTAAWVAHKYFGPEAQYVPMNYSDEPPDVRGRRVSMLDFSLKRPAMEKLLEESASLVVLDHHQTAEKELFGLCIERDSDRIIFDMNRSGAGIAWDYFFPDVIRPDLVNYVEDRDLWRFKLPESRLLNAYIQSFDIDLATWNDEFQSGVLYPGYAITGEALLRQQSKLVKSICEHAKRKHLPTPDLIDQHTCMTWAKFELDTKPAVHVQTFILMSEVCEQMLKDYPDPQYVWYSFERKDGKTQYGLRSRAGSDVDVSEIAKLYGGGGHKHAAGFEL